MPDLYKGGFFANPTLDVPTTDAALVAAHPTCCHANVWPSAALPGLKSAFQALGACVVDVGLLVAQLCDIYGAPNAASLCPHPHSFTSPPSHLCPI